MKNTVIQLELDSLDKWDYSSISLFKVCPQQWYLSRILPKQIEKTSTDLVAGAAYAKGLEVFRLSYFYKALKAPIAIQKGREALAHEYGSHISSKNSKTLERVLAAYDSYQKRWPVEEEPLIPCIFERDIPSIELKFLVPLTKCYSPLTGRQLFYSGRIDFLTEYNGAYYIVDDKTTGSYFSDTWASDWMYSHQMIGYVYAAQQLGYPCKGAIIRGTNLTATKIDHRQALVNFEPYQIADWKDSLYCIIQTALRYYTDSFFPLVGGYPCTRCPVATFCALKLTDKQRVLATLKEISNAPTTH